jgi:hypothetical protein
MSTLDEAIQAIKTGNREEGREMLEGLLDIDENDEDVWLWLCAVVDTDEDREICLENVLALNPDNIAAQQGLEALRSGTFDANIMIGEVEEEEDKPEISFIEEFSKTAAGIDDDELVIPKAMGGPGMAKKKKGGRRLNVRLIVLAVLVLLVLGLALTGLAASMFFMGGDTEGQAGQEAPAGGGEQPAVEATATDTPLPTSTPTPTATPFELPTPEPTKLPTATPTPVVQATIRLGQ